MARSFAFLLNLTLLLVCSSAFAQVDADVARLNDEGLHAFAEGRYAEAADIFGRAYSLEPRAELLKNEAVAWYRAERCDQAVVAAKSFLDGPDVPAAEQSQMRSLMGACKVRLAQEAVEASSLDLATRLLDEVEAEEPDAVLRDRVAAVRAEIAKLQAPAPVEAPKPHMNVFALDEIELTPTPVEEEPAKVVIAPPPQPVPRSHGALGPVLTVGGASLLAGGLVYHLVAKLGVERRFHEVAADGVDRERYDRLDRTLRIANIAVPVLYVLGAGMLGSGIYLWVDHPRNDSTVVGLGGAF